MIMIEPLIEFNIVTARILVIKDNKKYNTKMTYLHRGNLSENEVLTSDKFGMMVTNHLGDDAEHADSICVKIHYSNYSLN